MNNIRIETKREEKKKQERERENYFSWPDIQLCAQLTVVKFITGQKTQTTVTNLKQKA